MDTDKTENTAGDLENEEVLTESQETPETEKETSKQDTTSPEQEEETPETEEDEKVKPPKEETFEEAVQRVAKPLAQSMKDKELKPLQQKIADITKERDNWKLQATEKLINRKLARYAEEYDEKGDEKKAEQLKAEDQEFKKLYLDYEKNQVEVNRLKPELEQKVNALGMVERNFSAREEIRSLLFPEDKDRIAKFKVYTDRLEQAENIKDFEIILEGIKQEVKSKSKPFKPDSSKQGGGGGRDLSKLSPKELFILGQKKKK